MPKTKFNPIFLVLFTVALMFTLLGNGCVARQNNELKTLRVGINDWPGYTIAFYAQAAGLFEKRGLEVKLVRFDNLQDAARAAIRGSLDATFSTLWDIMQVDPGQDRPVLVMVTNNSYGSDGIVTQSGVQSVKDLRGKKVGAKLGTVNHLILLEALKLQQINPEEVQIEDVSNEIAAQRMKKGSLDGAVVWEPLLSDTAREISGNVAFTTKDVDSLVIDVLASSSSFVASHKAELTQFILAWFDLMHAVETKPDQVFEVVGKQLGQSRESFASDYAGLKKGDIAMNQRMFEPQGRLQEAKEQIIQLLRQDPRHSRIIREDIEINAEPVTAAIKEWKP